MSGNSDKENLLSKLTEGLRVSGEIQSQASELVQTARQIQDIGGALEGLVKKIPENDPNAKEKFVLLSDIWESHNREAQKVKRGLGGVTLYGVVAHANIAVSTSTAGAMLATTSFADPRDWTDAKAYVVKLDQFLSPETDAKELLATLARLSLKTGGASSKAPVELLQGAIDAMRLNDDMALALIPLRECLNAVLSALLRMRPKQEAAGSIFDKVVSIGSQCGKVDLPENTFPNIGISMRDNVSQLSGAKQDRISREEGLREFHANVLLLKSFLESLDEGKLVR